MIRSIGLLILVVGVAGGCDRGKDPSPGGSSSPGMSLKDARKGFQTKLTRKGGKGEAVDVPPPGLFKIGKYDAAAGKLPAYLTPDPKDGKKHPAIIWITGGDCNSIGEVWKNAPKENDQTAAAYRKAGIIMMFPSLRGGNDNPGQKEGFLGEVDDVLAAAEFLARQSYVDPQRIYLGGHSTGGTLVLLVSEYSERFRAVFSFGPVSDVRGYGPQYNPYDLSDDKEVELRSPGYWLASIESPTFVFDGSTGTSNIGELRKMQQSSSNSQVQFFPVPAADHFSALAPTNRLIAQKIIADNGEKCSLSFTKDELANNFGR